MIVNIVSFLMLFVVLVRSFDKSNTLKLIHGREALIGVAFIFLSMVISIFYPEQFSLTKNINIYNVAFSYLLLSYMLFALFNAVDLKKIIFNVIPGVIVFLENETQILLVLFSLMLISFGEIEFTKIKNVIRMKYAPLLLLLFCVIFKEDLGNSFIVISISIVAMLSLMNFYKNDLVSVLFFITYFYSLGALAHKSVFLIFLISYFLSRMINKDLISNSNPKKIFYLLSVYCALYGNFILMSSFFIYAQLFKAESVKNNFIMVFMVFALLFETLSLNKIDEVLLAISFIIATASFYRFSLDLINGYKQILLLRTKERLSELVVMIVLLRAFYMIEWSENEALSFVAIVTVLIFVSMVFENLRTVEPLNE